MNADNISRWASVIANVAMLGGLVLVAIQIQQNTSLQRIALINDGNVVSNQLYANVMGEEPGRLVARASECPERMSYADFMAVDAYLFSQINHLHRDYLLAQEGLFTDSDWKQNVDAYAHWLLGNPFGRAWWAEEAQYFFAPEFVEQVDRRLAREGVDSYAMWQRIRARITNGSQVADDACA